MNCEEAKQKISIRVVLESFNLFPVKENRRSAFYYALDRQETVASLSVDFVKNTAFDFGTGKSYDVISIVQLVKKCSVSDALSYLDEIDCFSSLVNEEICENLKKNYKIIKVGDIAHNALVEYLKSRRVFNQSKFVREIHYVMNGKKYFGIGFFNDSGGVEIRNKYSKICLGKKDITVIKNDLKNNNEVIVFEGFFDFLTYIELKNADSQKEDYIILNSTAMFFKAEEKLKVYSKISLFLDSDENGNSTKEMIKAGYKIVEDCSLLYSGFKDLNEWFIKKRINI